MYAFTSLSYSNRYYSNRYSCNPLLTYPTFPVTVTPVTLYSHTLHLQHSRTLQYPFTYSNRPLPTYILYSFHEHYSNSISRTLQYYSRTLQYPFTYYQGHYILTLIYLQQLFIHRHYSNPLLTYITVNPLLTDITVTLYSLTSRTLQ